MVDENTKGGSTMPWRDAIRDTETQKALVLLLVGIIKEALPWVNTLRLFLLERRVRAHHATCRQHRNNQQVHRKH